MLYSSSVPFSPCSCRPVEIPFYVGMLAPFVLLVLLNCVQLLAITITLRKTLMKSQARLHFLQSCLVLFLFAVGWALGLAMTGLSGVAADALGICFIVVGGLLGLYVFLIYCVVSPIVRNIWKEWFVALSPTHYKKYESSFRSHKRLSASGTQMPVQVMQVMPSEKSLSEEGSKEEKLVVQPDADDDSDSPDTHEETHF